MNAKRQMRARWSWIRIAVAGLMTACLRDVASAQASFGPVITDSFSISAESQPPFIVRWRHTVGVSGVLGSSWRCWPFDAAVQPATESKGRIMQAFDPSGAKQQFVSAGTNLWLPVDAAEARRISLQKTAKGFVLTDLLHGRQIFDSSGRLIQVSDTLGHRLDIVRDDKGRPKSVEVYSPAKASYEIICDPATRRLMSIKAPAGRAWSYEYDRAGGLAKATDPTGFALSYRSEDGRLAERADSVGHWARYRYDSQGRVLEIDRNGRKEARVYSKLGLFGNDWMVTRTDALGRTNEHRFLPSKRQEVFREPDGNVVVRQYDERWQLQHVSSLRDGVTSFERDAAGRAVKIVDPRERVTQIGYGGALGLPTSVVDSRGGARKLDYNAHGQLTSERQPDGRELAINYNDEGLPSEMTDSESGAVRFEYGPAGKLAAVESEAGRMETATLRQRARLGDFLSPPAFGGLPISEGRLRLLLRLSQGVVAGGPEHSLTRKVRTRSGAELTCSFDLFGNLTAIREKENPVATFHYDAGDRLREIQYADKRSERFDYDVADRVVAYTDATGKVFRYRYDLAGRLLRETFPDGEENVFDYDPDGRMVSVFNSVWHDLFAYDRQDRLVEVGRLTPASKGPEVLARYSYDGQSRLESQWFADGLRVAHEHNTNGTMETMQVQGAKLVIQKQKNGRPQFLFLPGGLKVECGYAKQGGLSRLVVQDAQGKTVLSQFGQYQNGRLTKVTSKTPEGSRDYDVEQEGKSGPPQAAPNDEPRARSADTLAPADGERAGVRGAQGSSAPAAKPKDSKNPRDAFGRLRLAGRDGDRTECLYGLGGLLSVETSGQRVRVIRSSDGMARAVVRERDLLLLVPSLVPDETLACDATGGRLRPIQFDDLLDPQIDLGKAGAK